MSKERLLVESYAGKVRVDREAGIIHDVLLLGIESENGVAYPNAVRQKAVALFENAKANLSHEEDRTMKALRQPRKFGDRVGKHVNVRNTPEGLRGDFKVLKSHPWANVIFEAAEESPDLFGMSPVMLGVFNGERDAKGREVCQEIKRVRSVDLVTDGGTTRGLFEDDAAEEEGPTAEQAYEQACQQAVAELVGKALSGSLTPEEAGKQVKDLLKQHLKAFKKKEEGGEEEPAEETTEVEEELRTLRVEKECRLLCESNDMAPTDELVGLLMDLPTKEARDRHMLTLKRHVPVKKPQTGQTKPKQDTTPANKDLLTIWRS